MEEHTAVSFNGRTLRFQRSNDGSEPSTATKPCARCKLKPRLSYHSYCKTCLRDSVDASHKRHGQRQVPYKRYNNNGTRRYNPEYYQRRYHEVRQRIDDYKIQHGCIDCGYNKHPAGLEFDHLPGQIKLASPTTLAGRGWKSVIKEIEKCEVVCGTCHNIRTWKRTSHGAVV